MDYVVAYAKQEALDPVIGQLKALGKGVAGAVLMAIGTVLLGIGFLRALQGQFGSAAGAGNRNSGTALGVLAAKDHGAAASAARTTSATGAPAGSATNSSRTTSATGGASAAATNGRTTTPSQMSAGAPTTTSGSLSTSAVTATTGASAAGSTTTFPTVSSLSSGRATPATAPSNQTTTSLVASAPPNPYGSGHPLSGNWSWVPYMGGALLCVLVAVFCVTRIVRGGPR